MKHTKVIYWLYACCFMVFAMAVIGAVTRLTESGLSMAEWRPLMGWIPPLNEPEWQRVYALYRQGPEFASKHNWMEISDFKKIFFWEWLHRLWGRTIGLVFTLPLVYFWLRKQIPTGYGWKLIGLLCLGGLQGFIGWWMVKSGLLNHPSVSHFRLAIHLGLALVIFSLLWWVALDLKITKEASQNTKNRHVHLLGWSGLLLLSLTIIWGAFVAGLDAGMIYNTFPHMDTKFTPDNQFYISSILVEQGWVQFTHRWIAIFTAMIILLFSWIEKNKALAFMLLLQVGLGISTLLTQVHIPLAALHQAGAIILLAVMLQNLHKLKNET